MRTVEDLAKHADKFGRKIYGIEPGAPVNQNMQAMIKAGDYGLAGWDVVESSEQAMLAQVDRAGRQKNWIVFVGWEPHPMNTKYKMTYLSGGEKTFGANYGASEVFTVARKGFTEDCPNLARLLGQTAVHGRDGERGHGRRSKPASSPSRRPSRGSRPTPRPSSPGSRASPPSTARTASPP